MIIVALIAKAYRSKFLPTPSDVYNHFRPLPYPTKDCTGMTVIVTGANTGIGREAARHFVRLNAARVILGCRNTTKGEAAKTSIETSTGRPDVVEVWQVDLGSFASVREFCRRADARLDRLDVLLENAGVAVLPHRPLEGHNEEITVNVISTMLMGLLLLPVLRRTAMRFNTVPHLTFVASGGHYYTDLEEVRDAASIFDELRRDRDMKSRYMVSKMLLLLAVRQLATETNTSGKPQVVINMLNPGFCRTELWRNTPAAFRWIVDLVGLTARSSEMGSRTLFSAAVAGEETHGRYMSNCVLSDESPWARSPQGYEVQGRVSAELKAIVDGVDPGVSNNI
ncbi:Uu.00g082560.m01.CDS01 [Anthostomella pinea]|uniref:Uu.00g082560.m01.CDS01 n=1 Tax=Anthostomella pinea TaxID=933095 RepID=A0AAI8VLD8_9PEZI|nr:Uu.00g082560.m01.CDS01 [Anthostomella pinea]